MVVFSFTSRCHITLFLCIGASATKYRYPFLSLSLWRVPISTGTLTLSLVLPTLAGPCLSCCVFVSRSHSGMICPNSRTTSIWFLSLLGPCLSMSLWNVPPKSATKSCKSLSLLRPWLFFLKSRLAFQSYPPCLCGVNYVSHWSLSFSLISSLCLTRV